MYYFLNYGIILVVRKEVDIMNKNYKKLRKALKGYKNSRFDMENLWKIVGIIVKTEDLDIVMSMIKYYQEQPERLEELFESKVLW